MKNQDALNQARKLKRVNSFLLVSTVIMFILFIAIVFASFRLQERLSERTAFLQEQKASVLTMTEVAELSKEAVVLKLPAVDKNGRGVVALLSVEGKEGEGRTLVDIDGLIFFADTQESIITAKKVASDYTKIDLSKYDLIYRIYAQADSIGGPSAGAALAIATISSLQDLNLKDDVMLTGRILPDGSIGDVSSIAEKALIAKENGAAIFLVPPGQSKEKVTEQARNCRQEGANEVCEIENVQKERDIGQEVGIRVVEVANVQQAINYFLE